MPTTVKIGTLADKVRRELEELEKKLAGQPSVAWFFRPVSKTVTRIGYPKRGRPRKGQAPSPQPYKITRSQSESFTIMNVHRKGLTQESGKEKVRLARRNFWFIAAHETRKMHRQINPLIERYVRGQTQVADRILQMVGDWYLTTWRAHIARGKTTTGGAAPLKPGYEESKRIAWGVKPIMERSGVLMDSIEIRKKVR
jgi:hypothetical protein